MRLIYKYPLTVGECSIDDMPLNAKILCVQAQRDQIWLWAEFDSIEEEVQERHFLVVGTGQPFGGSLTYIGTCQVFNGMFVWHVYEKENHA